MTQSQRFRDHTRHSDPVPARGRHSRKTAVEPGGGPAGGSAPRQPALAQWPWSCSSPPTHSATRRPPSAHSETPAIPAHITTPAILEEQSLPTFSATAGDRDSCADTSDIAGPVKVAGEPVSTLGLHALLARSKSGAETRSEISAPCPCAGADGPSWASQLGAHPAPRRRPSRQSGRVPSSVAGPSLCTAVRRRWCIFPEPCRPAATTPCLVNQTQASPLHLPREQWDGR